MLIMMPSLCSARFRINFKVILFMPFLGGGVLRIRVETQMPSLAIGAGGRGGVRCPAARLPCWSRWLRCARRREPRRAAP